MNLEKLETQVRALIDQDQKIEAIKLVRQSTGWGLRQSKAYVDALALTALLALDRPDEETLGQKVKALVQQDRYMEAIKLVQEQTGRGLRDSKDYVDALKSEKRRRKRRRKRAKTRPAGDGFQMGDSVIVKTGITDPDLGVDLGGWCGHIAEEPNTANMIFIRWDSITLRNMPDSMIVQCEDQGLDWTGMVLGVQDVEPTSPRDTEADVAQVVDELSKKYAWAYLGEEGLRISQVLAGIDPRDEMAILEAWEKHLRKRLVFPFDAEVSEHQGRKSSLRIGDRVTVQGIERIDDLYGVIIRSRYRQQRYDFPLCDLEATDERSMNYQQVQDYAVWYANR
jgi:ribosomal protein L7/L12